MTVQKSITAETAGHRDMKDITAQVADLIAASGYSLPALPTCL